MTEPWSPDAPSALRNSVRHVHRVYATHRDGSDRIELDVVSGTITYDEEATPYVQATFGVRIPADQETLDALDPRTDMRLEVWAGYLLDNDEDVHLLAELGLRTRNVRRPEEIMVLTAASDEALVQDWASVSSTGKAYPGNAYGGDVIADLLSWTDVPGLAIDQRATGIMLSFPFGPGLDVTRDDDVWSAIQDLADQSGLWVYHDGNGQFVIDEQPTLTLAPYGGAYSIGETGTITSSETDLTRNDFANLVIVQYQWTAPTDGSKTGWAEVETGPRGTDTIGRKAIRVVIDRASEPPWTASSVASSMVRRSITRGRSMSLEIANAAYWLRPGQRINVQLVTGPDEQHFASRVDIDLPRGTMHVRTRVPETVTITTGE